ncbi:hypothetical protein FD13_GL000813 [Levilactobacillus senmaizukei DSM 21775 = NBRC 103853]|uniref:Uncharacterized protein n=1 Tax=Levilactobacillus senmaizukei DSM 21775 = NBRC 103853 TaxID=1423803 RepID=A0A0R2DI36_9LACO|nr:hypothetical protein [Levilactobacillus senmaizukei]KRN03059.1 hypothetical protein FD13_GL000813 [Levilactobacillus senmaizukei DSM 21775 = NBRC 103853]
MSASSEAILIEILFGLGALIVIGGLVSLIIARKRRQSLRSPMTIIICGAGIAVSAVLLNVLMFKTYDNVRLKKNQYYEATSLTSNMRQSLASTRTANQPVAPNDKKASKNVTYLVEHTNQTKASLTHAQDAQQQLAKQHPDIKRIHRDYHYVLQSYFDKVVTPQHADQLTKHAYHQVLHFNKNA